MASEYLFEKLIHVKIWVLFPYYQQSAIIFGIKVDLFLHLMSCSIQIRWLQIWKVEIAPQLFINSSLISLGIWIFIITAMFSMSISISFCWFSSVFQRFFVGKFILLTSESFYQDNFLGRTILLSAALFLVLMTRFSNRFLSIFLFHPG